MVKSTNKLTNQTQPRSRKRERESSPVHPPRPRLADIGHEPVKECEAQAHLLRLGGLDGRRQLLVVARQHGAGRLKQGDPAGGFQGLFWGMDGDID